MNASSPRRLLLLTAALTLAALGALVLDNRSLEGHGRNRSAAAGAIAFQRLVGGLGTGPETDLSTCAQCMDLRLQSACSGDLGPLPAGGALCPKHAFSVLRVALPGEGDG